MVSIQKMNEDCDLLKCSRGENLEGIRHTGISLYNHHMYIIQK